MTLDPMTRASVNLSKQNILTSSRVLPVVCESSTDATLIASGQRLFLLLRSGLVVAGVFRRRLRLN